MLRMRPLTVVQAAERFGFIMCFVHNSRVLILNEDGCTVEGRVICVYKGMLVGHVCMRCTVLKECRSYAW